MNTDFENKLTPQHEEHVYFQLLCTPTKLKDNLLVELALRQQYGINFILPQRIYSSPFFAKRNSKGKVRIVVDLRRINNLLKITTVKIIVP